MRTQRSWAVAAIFALAAVSPAQLSTSPPRSQAAGTSTSDDSSRLPVKRVVLYKNGVGYFEHSARVHGTQDLNIDFTTAQLNDVLKSLTAVDLGDGRISGVRYNSIAPLEERLKALRLPFGDAVRRADFLAALRGARVEVRNKGEAATGRLLSVEQVDRTNDSGVTNQVTEFSVITDSGEMRNFDLGSGVSLRLAERDLQNEVSRYLNLVGSSRARDLRRMTISDSGSGDREIFVSYISEVPIWKSTYRIILPAKANEKPLLQGWAIVDNTIGEDWKEVRLSLIAGSPQSFIQDLSQPLYARRPVVALPQSVTLTPQTQEATMTENQAPTAATAVAPPPGVSLLGGSASGVGSGSGSGIGGGAGAEAYTSIAGTLKDPSGAPIPGAAVQFRNRATGATENTWTGSQGEYRFPGVTAGPADITFTRAGFKATQMYANLRPNQTNHADATLSLGTASETVEVTADELESTNDMPRKGREWNRVEQFAELEAAESRDLGDYFEYNIKQPITIGKNQSALVPILQSRIEAEKVTLWSADANQGPLRALWIKNASGLTLDSGTFNIIDNGTFAGEGLIATIHPDERRLLSYAADPAVRVTAESELKKRPATRIRLAKGVMIVTREQRSKVKYTVRNADTTARQVVIEHPVQEGWKLVDDNKPEETSGTHYRFRVAVDANKTNQLTVEEVHPELTRYLLTDLTQEQIDALVVEYRETPALKEAFHRVLEQKNQISLLQSDIESRQQEFNAINQDQARIRENMKVLKGSAEEKALLQRYTKQLDSEEDRLSNLKQETNDLERKKSQEQLKLDAMVQGVALDESF